MLLHFSQLTFTT